MFRSTDDDDDEPPSGYASGELKTMKLNDTLQRMADLGMDVRRDTMTTTDFSVLSRWRCLLKLWRQATPRMVGSPLSAAMTPMTAAGRAPIGLSPLCTTFMSFSFLLAVMCDL